MSSVSAMVQGEPLRMWKGGMWMFRAAVCFTLKEHGLPPSLKARRQKRRLCFVCVRVCVWIDEQHNPCRTITRTPYPYLGDLAAATGRQERTFPFDQGLNSVFRTLLVVEDPDEGFLGCGGMKGEARSREPPAEEMNRETLSHTNSLIEPYAAHIDKQTEQLWSSLNTAYTEPCIQSAEKTPQAACSALYLMEPLV